MMDNRRAGASTAAVGYARRSTDRQEQSIPDQRRAVEGWAEQNSYRVVDWYVDDAISGASADRDAFLKMIRDARQPDCPFSAVLCYDVKRFGRLDNDETGYYRHLLAQAGVEVVYVSEGFNGDDTDDLLRPVKQWQARQELKDLSKVTIRGLLSKGQGGWWLGGTPPYGYDLAYYDRSGDFLMQVRFTPELGKEVLDAGGNLTRTLEKGERLMISKEDRARLVLSEQGRVDTVRRIFKWYVHSGLGYKAIAQKLNSEGIPSPRLTRRASPGKWSMTTVREIICNPTYTGDMTWNRRSMAKFHRIESGRAVAREKMRSTLVRENEEEEWIVTEGSHPAIVSRELFEKARRIKAERSHWHAGNYRKGRGALSQYLLTGVIQCARCGHHWQGYTQRTGRKRADGSNLKTPYYVCGGYLTKGTSVCTRSVIQRDVLEGMILEEIGKNIRTFVGAEGGRGVLRSLLEEMISGEEELGGREDELSKLTAQKADIERRIGAILDNISAENKDFADKRIRELKEELRKIEPRIDELQAALGAKVDLDELTDAMMGYLESFEQVASEGTVDEKRRLVRAFTHKLELDPETGRGHAELLYLPKDEALSNDPESALSSFYMVAGASFVTEARPHLEQTDVIDYRELRRHRA